MKRVFIAVVAIILIGAIASMLIPIKCTNRLTSSISLARPNAAIRRDLLRITPIGTSMEDVRNILEESGWWYLRINRGNFMERNRLVLSDTARTARSVEIGTQTIGIPSLGRVLLVSHVSVHYAFDENSKLIDIAIGRYFDLL